MVRTVISLDVELKAWLDREARGKGKTMTAVVRQALLEYRAQDAKSGNATRAELLERTSGLWSHGDGLAWQDKLRGEWDSR